MDTIFALASAQGKAGVSVIRISGPDAWDVAQSLCGTLPASHRAGVRTLRDPQNVHLDTALVIPFEQKRSFTGEPVVEFQVHGSVAIIARVLACLGAHAKARLAEAGEFTRRALDNNQLDLAQVEGLADLIEAETEAQRVQALRVLSGELGNRAEAWRVKLIRAASLLEATIDFADEDVPVDVSPEVVQLLSEVRIEISREISGQPIAERIRSGFEVAIVGAPNVGKSTLLNALAGRDAAITSSIAGTTRDIIEVRMDLGGLPVTLLDTAGLRESNDVVESIGIERALERANASDVRLVLSTSGTWPEGLMRRPEDILLTAKDDEGKFPQGISGATGAGVPCLLNHVQRILQDRSANASLATRERHRAALITGLSGIDAALAQLEGGMDFADLAAEEVRTIVRALNSLIGHVDVENLLDEIFASFCLGK